MSARRVVLAAPCTTVEEGNPYIGQLYRQVGAHGYDVRPFSRRALLGRPEVIHVHWPEQLVRWSASGTTAWTDVVKVLGLLCLARLRGSQIVWTAHNLHPHDVTRPRLTGAYLRAFGALTSGVLSLSDAATRALEREHRWLARKQVRTVVHGHYRDLYPRQTSQTAARRGLGLAPQSRIILVLGQIRRYKQVPELIDRMESRNDPTLCLVVAGRVEDDELRQELLAASGPHTVLRLGHVPDAELPLLHAAADIVVLPYSGPSVLNSGAAILALSLARPVVVRRSEPMEELRDTVGADWVHLFDGGPEQALDVAAAVEPPRDETRPDLSALDWGRIGAQTCEFFDELVAAAPRGFWTGSRRRSD
ncbi:glycosyltransferase [Nocardioides sp. Leaf307]|uniref:glycosyltransferase n=1 Tax=Nocardioides sp. Leaf307 TaxID=1736331 RepID=UPI00070286D7|nr:glycosyltransferase [Nocardioides sp. Leaf307]KQQ42946.1 hypothetical protein ASF50_02725 [Nocardioides sp. Leaf307]